MVRKNRPQLVIKQMRVIRMSDYSLITENDLLTVSGLIFSTSIVTNGVCFIINLPARYVGLFVSIAVYFAVNEGEIALTGPGLIVFLSNVFIIYSGAVGTSAMASRANSTDKGPSVSSSKAPEEMGLRPKAVFFRNWW